MTSTPLAAVSSRGIAHEATTFRRPAKGDRVHMNGALVDEFGDSGDCCVFREWRHTTDPSCAGVEARAR
jgi:hypothetical protein